MHTLKFVAHSRRVIRIAKRFGWLPAARYTNLRDVRECERVGFLDIDWKDYNFRKHMDAVKACNPLITVARDVEDRRQLSRVLDQAFYLLEYCDHVVIVPKDTRLQHELEDLIPACFLLGYSVPTRYGGTLIPMHAFKRPVHLLGGRPEVQRKLAETLTVYSFDCNRFTLDAAYGDFFDGEIFRPHPTGGYERCIRDSLRNINAIWRRYEARNRAL
jgi:hypothetical protein